MDKCIEAELLEKRVANIEEYIERLVHTHCRNWTVWTAFGRSIRKLRREREKGGK